MASELIERLERSGSFPPAWDPVEGEILTGIVESYSEGDTPFGPCHVCVVQVEERRRDEPFEQVPRLAVWLGKTVLRKEFQRQRPQIGDKVGIRYLGKHKKGYRDFAMMVEYRGRRRAVAGGADYERAASSEVK